MEQDSAKLVARGFCPVKAEFLITTTASAGEAPTAASAATRQDSLVPGLRGGGGVDKHAFLCYFTP